MRNHYSDPNVPTSSQPNVFSPLYFHTLTNRFSCKPFPLTFIRKTPGGGGRQTRETQFSVSTGSGSGSRVTDLSSRRITSEGNPARNKVPYREAIFFWSRGPRKSFSLRWMRWR